MLRVFVDASVLFSAVYSPNGSAFDLIRFALQGKVIVILSHDVIDEVERNLGRKAPELVSV